jgi:hypothetical protein
MASALQSPAPLHVAFASGADYTATLDFNVNVTGYTWAASIFSLVNRDELATPTVTATDAAAGKVTLSIPRATVLPVGTLGLRITWTATGDKKRAVIEGTCEVLR